MREIERVPRGRLDLHVPGEQSAAPRERFERACAAVDRAAVAVQEALPREHLVERAPQLAHGNVLAVDIEQNGVQHDRQHRLFLGRESVVPLRLKFGHRAVIRAFVNQTVDVAFDAAVDGGGVQTGVLRAEFLLAAVDVGVNGAVEGVVAEKAVEIRRRHLPCLVRQQMHRPRERGEQPAGMLAVHSIAEGMKRTAEIDFPVEQRVGALTAPVIAREPFVHRPLRRGRQDRAGPGTEKMMRYQICHENTPFLRNRRETQMDKVLVQRRGEGALPYVSYLLL